MQVNRLPAELLAHIFHESSSVSSSSKLSETMREMVAFSHVCSHWRRIALSRPDLWRAVSSDHPQLASKFIKRSGSFPLNISINTASVTTTQEAISITLAELARTRSLVIESISTALLPTFTLSLCTPAPRLEEFTIRCPTLRSETRESLSYRLPKYLFAKHAPHLRRIALVGWGLDWTNPLAVTKSLTKLELYDIHCAISPSPLSILALLKQTVYLRELSVRQAILEHHPLASLQLNDTITISSLEKIDLDHEASWVATVFSGLSCPRVEYISFNCNKHSSPRDIRRLLSLVKSRKPYDQLSVIMNSSARNALATIAYASNNTCSQNGNRIRATITWSGSQTTSEITGILEAAMPSSVEYLETSSSLIPTLKTYHECSPKSVILTGRLDISIFASLALISEPRNELKESASVLWPKISLLDINMVGQSELLPQLSDIISQRAEAGFPFDTLRIRLDKSIAKHSYIKHLKSLDQRMTVLILPQ
jgi:hypothetical protein